MINLIPKKLIPYVVLFGAFLYNLHIGIINSYGNLNIYLTSYLRHKGNDVSYRDISLIYEICVITLGVSMLGGNLVLEKLGERTCILLGSFSAFMAFYLSSVFTHSYILLIILMGIVYAVGYGICFTIPLSCAYKHFKNNRGLISGIVISALSLSHFLFCQVQTFLINRDGALPNIHSTSNSKELYFGDEELLNRIPFVLFIQSLMLLFSCSLGGFLVTIENKESNESLDNKISVENPTNSNNLKGKDLEKNDEIEISQEQEIDFSDKINKEVKKDNSPNKNYYDSSEYNANLDTHITESFIKKNDSINGLNMKEKQINNDNSDKKESNALSQSDEMNENNLYKNKKTNNFYNRKCTEDENFIILWLSIVLFNSYINFIIMYWKIIGVNYTFVEDKTITLNGSFINSVSNIGGRIIWGYLYDKFNLSNILLLLGFCVCSCSFILPFTCHIYSLYLLFCAIFYFCIGGGLVTIPVITLKKYGEKYFSFNMSILYTTRIANTLICSTLVNLFYNLLTLKFLSASFGLVSIFSTISIYILTK